MMLLKRIGNGSLLLGFWKDFPLGFAFVTFLLLLKPGTSNSRMSNVEAFSTSPTPSSRSHGTNIATTFSPRCRRNRDRPLLLFPAEDKNDSNNKNKRAVNNNDTSKQDMWLERRVQKANFLEIRRDAILVTCFVLSRFLVYDILTSTKVTPGWVAQDLVLLTGTFSSATLLVVFWTIAGLLSKSFENSNSYGPVQVLVNVALCCPIWLATEHFLQFGPSNIGGDTLSQAVATGFLGLASFMTLARSLTSGWE
jgi:hypothetical protein